MTPFLCAPHQIGRLMRDGLLLIKERGRRFALRSRSIVSCLRSDRGSSVGTQARSSQLTEWPGLLETMRPLIVGRLSNLDIARSQFQGAGSTWGACSATGHDRCNAKNRNARQSAPSRNPQLHNSSQRSLPDASVSLPRSRSLLSGRLWRNRTHLSARYLALLAVRRPVLFICAYIICAYLVRREAAVNYSFLFRVRG